LSEFLKKAIVIEWFDFFEKKKNFGQSRIPFYHQDFNWI